MSFMKRGKPHCGILNWLSEKRIALFRLQHLVNRRDSHGAGNEASGIISGHHAMELTSPSLGRGTHDVTPVTVKANLNHVIVTSFGVHGLKRDETFANLSFDEGNLLADAPLEIHSRETGRVTATGRFFASVR